MANLKSETKELNNKRNSPKVYIEADVTFKNQDGFDISGKLVECQSEIKKDDFIIFLHGFAGDKDENGLFSDAAKLFAQYGFSSLRFDFFGHGHSAGDPKSLTLLMESSDFKSSIAFLESKYNPQSFIVIGFSLGAFVAIINPVDKIKCLILWSPALFPDKDMYPRYCEDKLIMQQIEDHGYFKKSDLLIGKSILDDFKTNNVTQYIKEISTPIRIIHGMNDQRINWISSNNFVTQYNDTLDVDGFYIENAGHSYKEDPAFRDEVFCKTIEWINKN